MNNYTTPDLFQLLFVSHLPTCQYNTRTLSENITLSG